MRFARNTVTLTLLIYTTAKIGRFWELAAKLVHGNEQRESHVTYAFQDLFQRM